VHDIGELSVPVSTWMRACALTARETDTVRLHPYHGERALASLGEDGKPVAALVLRHHERLDGSGYHRYARAPDLSPAARLLAAARAFPQPPQHVCLRQECSGWPEAPSESHPAASTGTVPAAAPRTRRRPSGLQARRKELETLLC